MMKKFNFRKNTLFTFFGGSILILFTCVFIIISCNKNSEPNLDTPLESNFEVPNASETAALIKEIEKDLPQNNFKPLDENLLRKIAKVENRGCAQDCYYDIRDCPPGICTDTIKNGTKNFGGCTVNYYYTLIQCQDAFLYSNYQIFNLTITPVAGCTNINFNRAFDYNITLPGNTPAIQSHYYNIFLWGVLQDIYNFTIIPMINANPTQDEFGTIRTVIPKSCWKLCNGVYTKCGTGCCSRLEYFGKENGQLNYWESVNEITGAYGGCKPIAVPPSCSSTAVCSTMNCNLRI